MRIAIMQPYIFPYIGYFQLIRSVEKFIVYDDVNFIKQGWINRNNILVNGARHLFTIPVESLTSFKKINETKISGKNYDTWLSKFFRTMEQSYKKAPHFNEIAPLVSGVLERGRMADSISDLCRDSIKTVANYLEVGVEMVDSSSIYGNEHLTSYERVLDICKKERASVYINAIGGQELYSKDMFRENGIELFFLESGKVEYGQLNHSFVPYLSMIDVLMFNSKTDIGDYLKQFNLV